LDAGRKYIHGEIEKIQSMRTPSRD
jgi:hypothetical protein